MKLVFVRHGETASNVAGVLESAVPGPPLTESGWAQAQALPEALAGHRIDAIYASTQLRALQTASVLAAHTGKPVHVRHGLREVEGGDFELRGDQAAIEGYWDAISAWAAGDLERVMPGGDPGTEVFRRFDEVITEIAADGHEAVVVVSHGGAIRGWTAARGTRSPAEFIAGYPLDNTGIVEMVGDLDAGWSITGWMGVPLAVTAPRRREVAQ